MLTCTVVHGQPGRRRKGPEPNDDVGSAPWPAALGQSGRKKRSYQYTAIDDCRGGAAGCGPAPCRSAEADPRGTYFRPKARVMLCVTVLPSVSAALVRSITNRAWAGAFS
jgi:hypothetical protein